MKLILSLILIFCMAGLAQAAPSLVCDAQPDVKMYSVTIDGVTTDGIVPKNGWVVGQKLYLNDPGGTRTPVHILMDLASTSTGSHNATAKACNEIWGCSAASAVYPFTKSIPGVPTSISIAGP